MDGFPAGHIDDLTIIGTSLKIEIALCIRMQNRKFDGLVTRSWRPMIRSSKSFTQDLWEPPGTRASQGRGSSR